MAKVDRTSAVVDLFPKNFLVSIKPEYASAIIEGRKTVELRRKFPDDAAPGSQIYIYSSSPVQAIVGIAIIQKVDRLPIDTLWQKHGHKSCIDRDAFIKYFAGQSEGFGVVLRSVLRLRHPVTLDNLKSSSGFSPPQSYMYVSAEMERKIAHEGY